MFATILFFMLCIQINPNDMLWANKLLYSGYPVSATPFDQKLNSVGFFNGPKTIISHFSHARSVKELFMIARSYRYLSNAANRPWQSAEETTLKGSGNCADKAVWLYTELTRNGYNDVSLVIGKYCPIDTKLHAWVTYVDKSEHTFILDSALQRQILKVEDFPEGFYIPLYSFSRENRYFHGQ